MLLSACSTQSASHPSDQFSSREAIFVTNAVDNSVNIYPIGSRGDSGPIATIKGPATGLDDPVSIALDSSGKIYVLNNGTAGNSASIEVFAPGSRGNVAPIARIAGPATRLLSVNRIAVDSAGQIYVAIEVVDVDSQPAGILIYPPGQQRQRNAERHHRRRRERNSKPLGHRDRFAGRYPCRRSSDGQEG